MPSLLLLEDNASDLRNAAQIAHRAGFTEFEVYRFAEDAQLFLEKGMRGESRLPDAMVIDLDLGMMGSGFELLRFWHGNPQVKQIPVIIWTLMDTHEREICDIFGVTHFVGKYEGPEALFKAVASIIAGAN